MYKKRWLALRRPRAAVFVSLLGALMLVGASCESGSDPGTDSPGGDASTTTPAGPRRIAFISNRDRDGEFHIYTMDGDGSDVRMLSETAVADAPFSVSNDETQIVAVAATGETGAEPIGIVRIDAKGGDSERIAELPQAGPGAVFPAPRWAPEDRELLIQHQEICYAVPSGGGDAEERSADDCLMAQIRAEGPDGRWAAIAGDSLIVGEGDGWDSRPIDTVVPDGTEDDGFAGLAFLALQVFGVMRPLWSPDGERIAYIDADAGGQHGIAVIDADGSNGQMLVVARGEVSLAIPGVWSEDGSRVIFSGMEDHSSLDVVEVDGPDAYTLLGGDGYSYKHPRWVVEASPPDREAGSRDATHRVEDAKGDLAAAPGRLLYEQGYYGGFLTARPDCSGEQQLTEDSPYPSFATADGRWLSFSAGQGLSGTVTIVDTLTGERREVAQGSSPTVSPSGDQVAYWDGALIVLEIASGATRYFSAQAGIDPEEAAWSPDGNRLAFFDEVKSYDDEGGPAFALTVVDLASGDSRVIAESESGLLDGGPIAWSPDGSRIAFDDGILRVAQSDGSGVEDYPLDATSAAWSPDGKRLAVRGSGIVLVDPDSGDVTELTNDVAGAVEYPPAWSPDGEWLAYSGSDETLRVMHVASRTIIRPGQEADIVRWLSQ